MNTGPVCAFAAAFAWMSRTASVKEVWVRAARYSCGTAERSEIR